MNEIIMYHHQVPRCRSVRERNRSKMRQKERSRRRGPKQPLPLNSNDSVYYAAIDAAENYHNHDYYDESKYSSERCYIDPWDLENYDYVRRQLAPPSRSSTPSPAGEPISSNFFYLSNGAGRGGGGDGMEDCPACYAGMDEQTFYNAKYETILDDDQVYSTYTDFEISSSNERNSSYSDSSAVSTLMLHTPGFGPAAGGRRRMVLPKPAPRLEFPSPPPYDYPLPTSVAAMMMMPPPSPSQHENNYYSLSDCYDCCMSTATDPYIRPLYSSSTLYSTGGGGGKGGVGSTGGGSSIYSNYYHRFGLSKKGLLQIDYSCNWNDLDRYIAKDF